MKKLILTVCLAIMYGSITPGIARADLMYAITFDNELLSIDASTGAGTLIGNLDSSMAAFGLSDRGTSVYTFNQHADRIIELDLATGGTLATIDIGFTTSGEGALAFRSDGIGFLSRTYGSTGTLWSFDTTVPSSTTIGGLNPGMDGLDFNGSDVLYGISASTRQPALLRWWEPPVFQVQPVWEDSRSHRTGPSTQRSTTRSTLSILQRALRLWLGRSALIMFLD